MRIRCFYHVKPLVISVMATLFWFGTPAIAQRMTGQNSRSVQDNDMAQQELSSLDQFLGSHPKLAEQVRKDPSLVNSDEFLKNHPALQSYLQDHPTVQREIKEKPNTFMEREALHERHDTAVGTGGRDQDAGHENLHRQFGQFLGRHSSIAQKLSKDPSLVRNQEFMEKHSDLKQFLSSHLDVQEQLMKDPQGFLNSSKKFNSGTENGETVVTY